MKGDGIPLTPTSGPLLPSKDLFGGLIGERQQAYSSIAFCETCGSDIGAMHIAAPFEAELRRKGLRDEDTSRRRDGYDSGGKRQLRAENGRRFLHRIESLVCAAIVDCNSEAQAAARFEFFGQLRSGRLHLERRGPGGRRRSKYRVNGIPPCLAQYDGLGMPPQYRGRRVRQQMSPISPRVGGIQRRIADGVRKQEPIP